MFTIERTKEGQVFFEINGSMVSKINGKWFTDKGEKFDRNVIHNMLHSKTVQRQGDRSQLKSVLNRYFQGNYKFN